MQNKYMICSQELYRKCQQHRYLLIRVRHPDMPKRISQVPSTI